MTTRFALLEHTLPNGEKHFDLLIERGGQQHVPTWRLVSDPTRQPTSAAERIADHRPLYLDYQGAISGDRGTVRRIDAGPGEFQMLDDPRAEIILQGAKLRGRFTIAASERGLHFAPATSDPADDADRDRKE
jgi:hypothetical protein